jgi:predicted transcriptional regulator
LRLPCETVVRQLLPSFRYLVAKELVHNHSYSQTDAAKRVGTTQAAISQYFHAKRGRRWSSQSKLLSEIEPHAAAVAKKIAHGNASTVDSAELFCALCQGLRKKGLCGLRAA